MDKPIVFISHITEEKDMAKELKKLIEDSFLGMLEVFVSSDENSISIGSRWLDNITDSLRNCAIELILCSPKSVKRPWINFEAGAGWIREIPVIPLCHSGMEPSKLPIPLNLLQAARISDISSLKLIFPVLANAIGAKCPNIMFDEFIGKMKRLEEKYTFWDEINSSLKKFHENYRELFNILRTNNIRTELNEIQIKEIEEILKPLVQKGYIHINKTGNLSITEIGMTIEITIWASDDYRKLFEKDECEF